MKRARALFLLSVTLLALSSSSLASRPRPSLDASSASTNPLTRLKRAVGETLRSAVAKGVNGAKKVASGKPAGAPSPAHADADVNANAAAGENTADRAREAESGGEEQQRGRDLPVPDDGAHLHRRVLVESPLSPWIQPTTFLRVALLIIRNAALDNPAAGFLQSILTTELAYTVFTNVFASFAAAVVQDFSQVGRGRGR